MTTNPKRALVRDVMHAGCSCVPHEATMIEAAKQMSEEGVGALPICGPDERLIGMLTDRDIVVHCLATDRDPTVCTAGELASGRIIWVTETTSISGDREDGGTPHSPHPCRRRGLPAVRNAVPSRHRDPPRAR